MNKYVTHTNRICAIKTLMLKTLAVVVAAIVDLSAQEVSQGTSRADQVTLDPLIESDAIWGSTGDALEAAWKESGFNWLSSARDKAAIRIASYHFNARKLAILSGLNVEEVVFDFKEGSLKSIVMLAWSKGDSEKPDISEKDFEKIVNDWILALNKHFQSQAVDPGKESATVVKSEKRRWSARGFLAQLEWSSSKVKNRDPWGRETSGRFFQAEFLRLRLLPAASADAQVAGGKTANVSRGDLAKLVKREPSGDILIADVPMVDQGDKGYCAVATAARVLNYYGVQADQHEMAKVAGSTADRGTNPDEMEDALKKLQGRYKIRYRSIHDLVDSIRDYDKLISRYNRTARRLGKKTLDENFIHSFSRFEPDVLREMNGKGQPFEKFMRAVVENIDKGVPIMWSLRLGLFPENGEPARQAGGGHMRLIIGYNLQKNEILFSDSWGEGHEIKRMAAPDASAATFGLYLMQPGA